MKKLFHFCFAVLILSLFITLPSFAQYGVVIAGNGTFGSANNQLYGPEGMVLDPAGNLYVSDWYNSRIMQYAPGASSGVVFAQYSQRGPTDLFLDKAGNLYVADGNGSRILKYPAGSNTAQVVTASSVANNFSTNDGLFVDDLGVVYFIDNNHMRLLKYVPGTPTPTTLLSSGKSLADVFMDSGGNINLSEYRIQAGHRSQHTGQAPAL